MDDTHAHVLHCIGPRSPEDVLRLQEAEEACSEEMWVILGDIYMDRPLVVAALRRVLGTFDAMEPPPALFVFMGDFCSHPAGASASGLDASKGALPEEVESYRACMLVCLTACATVCTAAFESLGEVLREFNTLLEHSAFAFVPGPGDPSLSPTLPRPGLPLSLTRALRAAAPKAVLCSSPSRLRWHATDVVLFREDLAARMRRACVLPPVEDPPGNGDAMDEGTAEENVHESPEATAAKAAHARGCSLFSSLCATVLQQSHLVPLPLVHAPCLWQYDHSLWLFPQPQVLIMADRTAPQTSCEFEGCTCINPGAFGADGSFVVFKPATREVQLSGLPLSDTVS
jgi:DNA polymerase epsilon subunit 2